MSASSRQNIRATRAGAAMNPAGVSPAFAAFQRGREAELADFPLPAFSPATKSDFRVTSRATRIDDVAIADLHGTSVIRTEGPPGGPEDVVRLYLIDRGGWTLGGGADGSEQMVPAGQFLFRHVTRPVHFQTAPDTKARIVILPAAMLAPLLGNRAITA